MLSLVSRFSAFAALLSFGVILGVVWSLRPGSAFTNEFHYGNCTVNQTCVN